MSTETSLGSAVARIEDLYRRALAKVVDRVPEGGKVSAKKLDANQLAGLEPKHVAETVGHPDVAKVIAAASGAAVCEIARLALEMRTFGAWSLELAAGP